MSRCLSPFRRLCLVLVLLQLFLPAFGSEQAPYYGLEVKNRTGEPCTEIVIEFGARAERSSNNVVLFSGHVVNGNESVSDDFGDPAPAQATVRWTTQSGRSFVQVVHLKPMKGAALRDVEYVFILRHDGTVRAAPFTLAERLDFQDIKLGCDGGPGYCVGVKNLTNGKLRNVVIQFGRYQVNAGSYVEPPEYNHGWSFSHCLPYPLTNTATVRWTTADGAAHSEEVALKPLLPEAMDGNCICFLLGRSSPVAVRVVPLKDLRAGTYPDLHPGWKQAEKRSGKAQ